MKITIPKLRTIFSYALTIASIGLLGLLFQVTHFRMQSVSAQQSDYAQIKARAEQEYAAGSYARAYESYGRVSKAGLPAEEIPGAFHALPVLGHAMYVPEIRTNGAEIRIKVMD